MAQEGRCVSILALIFNFALFIFNWIPFLPRPVVKMLAKSRDGDS